MKVYLTFITLAVFIILKLSYAINLPKNLSPEAEVGKKIFFEPLFGEKTKYSCNSCHNIQKFCGADSRRVSPGFKVNAPTIFNVANNRLYFWEGKRMSLKEAVDYHITNKYHLKMSKEKLLTRVKSNEGLYKRIKKVYGRVSYENVVDALENFLKALTFEAKIDKFLSGNNEALSKQEYEGYILFKNLGCRDCHSGKNFGGEIKANTHGNKRGYWRVPSLRFVVCTAPYLHNGSKDTLDEALEYTIETFIGIKLGKEKINKLKLFLKTLGNK